MVRARAGMRVLGSGCESGLVVGLGKGDYVVSAMESSGVVYDGCIAG